MTKILHIETATEVCSVALSENDKILVEKIDYEKQNHAKILTVLIDNLLSEYTFKMSNLDAVSVSMGPGSYTGLRIGLSVAKGICFAKDIPLIAINTLQVMAYEMRAKETGTHYCPMIDARRMEVYCQFFDVNMQPISKVEAKILDENSFTKECEKQTIVFGGNGSDKFAKIHNHPNSKIVTQINPLASALVPFAWEAFLDRKFVDTAYFTPFYLKKTHITKPNNKL